MATPDAYYDKLFGSEAGKSAIPPQAPKGVKNLKSRLGGLNVKSMGAQVLGLMLIDKLLNMRHQSGLRDIESERMTRQGAMASPENLILQASLPQAQEEEQMARTALLTQLSGGVIGPQLARGERRI